MHFKETTYGFPVIMGRKTYESLGKSLDGRINIVLSRQDSFETKEKDLVIYKTIDGALNFCEEMNPEKVFIIGGNEIFRQTIDIVDELIISYLKESFEGDIFFPEIKKDKWHIKQIVQNDQFDVVTYSRKKN